MLATRNLPLIEAFGLLESSISRKGNGSCETWQPSTIGQPRTFTAVTSGKLPLLPLRAFSGCREQVPPTDHFRYVLLINLRMNFFGRLWQSVIE